MVIVNGESQQSTKECPTCKGKRFVENHKCIYECPDCGEMCAKKPTPQAKALSGKNGIELFS
jgi:ribosomal protein L37AE/L43A